MRSFGRKSKYWRMLPMLLAVSLIAGCTNAEAGFFKDRREAAWAEEVYSEALVRAADRKYQDRDFGISSPQTAVKKNDKAIIDYSNASDGYVTVKWTGGGDKKLRVQVSKDDDSCLYAVSTDEWATLPLARGSGRYKVTVFENVGGSKYAMILSEEIVADCRNELSVFLKPNLFVNYTKMPVTQAAADVIAEQSADEMSKAENTLKFVTQLLSYDRELAATVKDDYIPELDSVLEGRKGICFDYASLMTALLRCMGVPCKLVTGYAGETYHAWLSIWSEDEGWIDGIIYFDGKGWQRADPTFADADASNSTISQYIGDGSNYVEKHFY